MQLAAAINCYIIYPIISEKKSKLKKKCYICPPLWTLLLCWMSDCLVWLIILPFRRTSQVHPGEGLPPNPHKLGGRLHLLFSSCPISTLFYTAALFLPHICLPCSQTHVNTRSACWDQTCWVLCWERPSRRPCTTLGVRACQALLWIRETVKLWNVWSLGAHLSPGGDCRSSGGPKSYSAGYKGFFLNSLTTSHLLRSAAKTLYELITKTM